MMVTNDVNIDGLLRMDDWRNLTLEDIRRVIPAEGDEIVKLHGSKNGFVTKAWAEFDHDTRNEGSNECVKTYVQKHSIRVEVEGAPLLHLACKRGASAEVLEHIIKTDPEAVRTPDRYGCFALHNACWTGRATDEVIQCLVNACPIALRSPDKYGKLPLHLACTCFDPGVSISTIRFLVEAFPEALRLPDRDGRLPLHLACWEGLQLETMRYLVEQYPEALRIRDFKYRNLPLHYAMQRYSSEPSIFLAYMIVLLRPYPEAVFTRNWKRQSPLDLYVDERDLQFLSHELEEILEVMTYQIKRERVLSDELRWFDSLSDDIGSTGGLDVHTCTVPFLQWITNRKDVLKDALAVTSDSLKEITAVRKRN